ncbi:MAG: OmpA family protein [Endomicrobiales bacterium]|jgi:outer membrane protein OmpA-like peptidoglycan-associated protein
MKKLFFFSVVIILPLFARTDAWSSHFKQVSMEFNVDPRIFSPNNDGVKDSVFFVPKISDIKNIKRWVLTIRDSAHTLVKTFSGMNQLPRIISWAGETDAKGHIGEGKYYAQFIAEGDGRKRAESDIFEIIADVTPPTVSLQASNETLSPGGTGLTQGTTYFISATDLNGIDSWVLNINNVLNKPVKVFKSDSITQVSVYWDGTDDYYNAVVPNGVYTAVLSVMDNAGNRSQAEAMCTVSVAPKVKEVVREVQITETKKGLVINLASQVLFDAGKAALKPEANKSLDEVVSILQTYPDNQVLIDGYSDTTGSRQKNVEISTSRARNVYNYFVQKGLKASRLKATGYGPDHPIASNKTSSGRAQNRRVEITILKQP